MSTGSGNVSGEGIVHLDHDLPAKSGLSLLSVTRPPCPDELHVLFHQAVVNSS
jgi:hypothetical protein